MLALIDFDHSHLEPMKDQTSVLKLRVGERVRVRSLSDVLATLDANGCLDSLPFMPEMADCCEREFTVLKRVDKVNDLVDRSGLRRMTNAVILEEVRCNGAHHGGCHALCQSIWKEAWLNSVDADSAGPRRGRAAAGGHDQIHGPIQSREDLLRSSRLSVPRGEERFVCQVTEIKKASAYLAWWDPRQYVRDLWSGNVTVREMI